MTDNSPADQAALSSNPPRVLVAHQFPFNERDGGGLRMMNYFDGWPTDRIAQIYGPAGDMSPEALHHVDYSICSNYYLLTDSEFSRPWPMSRYYQSRSGGVTEMSGRCATENPAPAASSGLKPALRNFARRAGLTQPTKFRPSAELTTFVRDFAPQVIFSVLGSIAWIRAISWLSDYTRAQPVLFLNDDWPSDQFTKGLYAAGMRPRQHSELGALARRSSNFVVSETMATEFGQRYGATFEVLPATVDVARWRAPAPRARNQGPWRLLYAGTVQGFAQRASLVDVARVAQQLTDSGFATRLTISTPREFARDLAELDLGPAAEVIPHDTQSDVIGHVHDADALLLPVNFDADSLRFVRYSMPGKFSAYMASGRPILVYGPPGVPPVDEAIRFNVGLAVTERSQEALAAAIRRLQTDEGLVASLVASAEKRVATHDAVTVKERFRNVLAQAAAEAGP